MPHLKEITPVRLTDNPVIKQLLHDQSISWHPIPVLSIATLSPYTGSKTHSTLP